MNKPTVLPSRKQLLPFFSFGFLALSLIVTTVLVQMRHLAQKRAAGGVSLAVLELEAVGQGGDQFSITPGESFDVALNLQPVSTDGLSAVDVVLDFDCGLLELIDIVPNTGGNLVTFVPRTFPDGDGFDKDAVLTAANVTPETAGVIRFGAAAFDYTAAGGEGDVTDPQLLNLEPLATLTFEVRDTGQGGTARIEFGASGFTGLGDTKDSNAVEWVDAGSGVGVEDILTEPTSVIEAVVTLGISLPASLIPEAISATVSDIPISVTLTNEVTGGVPFDNIVSFVRDSSSFVTDGNISFTPISTTWEADTYGVRVKGPLHLSQTAAGVVFVAGENALVDFSSGGAKEMFGGDLAVSGSSYNTVDIYDAVILSVHYDTDHAEADINFDGQVDIYDAVLLSKNYGRSGN